MTILGQINKLNDQKFDLYQSRLCNVLDCFLKMEFKLNLNLKLNFKIIIYFFYYLLFIVQFDKRNLNI